MKSVGVRRTDKLLRLDSNLVSMKICSTIQETRAASRELRSNRKRLGLVPTMGALHEGHLSLVRAARSQYDAVAVSIFVNPTQFGPTEDLSKYPRQFDRDCQLLRNEGIDILERARTLPNGFGLPDVPSL